MMIGLKKRNAPKSIRLGALKIIYDGKIFLTSEQVGILFTLQNRGVLPKTFQALAYRTTLGMGRNFIPTGSVESWIKINRIQLVEEVAE